MEGEGAHSMRYRNCFNLGDVAVWPELCGRYGMDEQEEPFHL